MESHTRVFMIGEDIAEAAGTTFKVLTDWSRNWVPERVVDLPPSKPGNTGWRARR